MSDRSDDEPTHVVTAFLRNRGEVLLLRRSDAVGTYPDQWGGVSGFAEGRPDEAVRWEIEEETGFDATPPEDGGDPDVRRVRAGSTVRFVDPDLGREWAVRPYLFDCRRRDVRLSEEHVDFEWAPPTETLRRDCVPELWTAYRRVAPTVRSIAADDEHGSAYLSVRALELLRDRAGQIAPEDDAAVDAWAELADLARRLRQARPSMAALHNRVNRVMATADRDPSAVEGAAIDGVQRAIEADEDAAGVAAALVADSGVLTLSRSGTVTDALERGDPTALFVAESRPAREGIRVAERFAGDCPVTVHTDAAIAHVCAEADVDAVLVGADTVLPDGSVVNKTGTRVAALAADREDIPCYAVAASDKVTTDETVRLESGEGTAVYDGPAPLSVANPTFDVTPPDLLDGIVTEDGRLRPTEVRTIAERLADLSRWDRTNDDGR